MIGVEPTSAALVGPQTERPLYPPKPQIEGVHGYQVGPGSRAVLLTNHRLIPGNNATLFEQVRHASKLAKIKSDKLEPSHARSFSVSCRGQRDTVDVPPHRGRPTATRLCSRLKPSPRLPAVVATLRKMTDYCCRKPLLGTKGTSAGAPERQKDAPQRRYTPEIA